MYIKFFWGGNFWREFFWEFIITYTFKNIKDIFLSF